MAKKRLAVLSVEDAQKLRAIVRDLLNESLTTTGRAALHKETHASSVVYVAKTGTGGINGLSGTEPGAASCDIYRIYINGTTPTLVQVGSTAKRVYNIDARPVNGSTWIIVNRDGYGYWLASSGFEECCDDGTPPGDPPTECDKETWPSCELDWGQFSGGVTSDGGYCHGYRSRWEQYVDCDNQCNWRRHTIGIRCIQGRLEYLSSLDSTGCTPAYLESGWTNYDGARSWYETSIGSANSTCGMEQFPSEQSLTADFCAMNCISPSNTCCGGSSPPPPVVPPGSGGGGNCAGGQILNGICCKGIWVCDGTGSNGGCWCKTMLEDVAQVYSTQIWVESPVAGQFLQVQSDGSILQAAATSNWTEITADATTTDATTTTLYSLTLDDNTLYEFYFEVEARYVSGAGGAAGDAYVSAMYDSFERHGTAPARIDGAAVPTKPYEVIMPIFAGATVTTDVNSNDARVRITGIATTTYNWRVTGRYRKVA